MALTSTLADVARRAGVSQATASRVINDSAYPVTDDLRRRVLAAAEELHYVPNANAQALVRARAHTVGVIVHDLSDPYFSEIVRGMQQVAAAADRLVMVCNTYRDLERELAYVRLLHAQRVEAIILAGSGFDDRQFSERLTRQVTDFTAAGGRLALIGRHHVAGDAVIPDNAGGARAMGQALLALGHRRFGVVGGQPLLTTTRDRLAGFRSALAEAGVELPPQNIVDGAFTRDGGAAATERLLGQAPGITAIFALNDTMAVGVLATLRARKIAVPDAISVAGFDDIPMTRDMLPAISTVRVPMEEMGARAMRLALAQYGSELRVDHLPTEVILRDSTAAPPAHGRYSP